MSHGGFEAKRRKNLVKRKRASMLPIRTNVWQALKAAGLTDRNLYLHTRTHNSMADKPVCPKCHSGNVYILVGGEIVCRSCGYDERKEKENKR